MVLVTGGPGSQEHGEAEFRVGKDYRESEKDVEKEEEVVSKNGILGTVWKQCCQSPWARQTQKSKE